jgi:CheY-like chemotaxis protein
MFPPCGKRSALRRYKILIHPYLIKLNKLSIWTKNKRQSIEKIIATVLVSVRAQEKELFSKMLTVLVIDKDPGLCDTIEDILKQEIGGLVVYKAENGMDGVKIAKKHHLDLLILSLFLKTQMAADEIIKQIKSLRPKIKIIIQSGYDITSATRQDKATMGRIKKLGYDAYLVKVYNELALVYAVKQSLN